ncbi:hypothetical protein BC938DRAFT_473914 [Jimgerdemannia flammicorona]|uniref:Uncharacterized protein n=1 Tax=Jimgerdemannia flammicorona TaxID=994334 RepID=A0A433Q399_9FUNG|nr:hypothetical protein BC938DRAFT_473914 [Jimgerdemannia flammicorona]
MSSSRGGMLVNDKSFPVHQAGTFRAGTTLACSIERHIARYKARQTWSSFIRQKRPCAPRAGIVVAIGTLLDAFAILYEPSRRAFRTNRTTAASLVEGITVCAGGCTG